MILDTVLWMEGNPCSLTKWDTQHECFWFLWLHWSKLLCLNPKNQPLERQLLQHSRGNTSEILSTSPPCRPKWFAALAQWQYSKMRSSQWWQWWWYPPQQRQVLSQEKCQSPCHWQMGGLSKQLGTEIEQTQPISNWWFVIVINAKSVNNQQSIYESKKWLMACNHLCLNSNQFQFTCVVQAYLNRYTLAPGPEFSKCSPRFEEKISSRWVNHLMSTQNER